MQGLQAIGEVTHTPADPPFSYASVSRSFRWDVVVDFYEEAGVYYIRDAANGDEIHKGLTEELPPHLLEALRSDLAR